MTDFQVRARTDERGHTISGLGGLIGSLRVEQVCSPAHVHNLFNSYNEVPTTKFGNLLHMDIFSALAAFILARGTLRNSDILREVVHYKASGAGQFIKFDDVTYYKRRNKIAEYKNIPQAPRGGAPPESATIE